MVPTISNIIQSSCYWNSVVKFFINPTFAANKGHNTFYISTCSKAHLACLIVWYSSQLIITVVVLVTVIFIHAPLNISKQEFPIAVHDAEQSIMSKLSFYTSLKRTGQENKHTSLTPPTLSITLLVTSIVEGYWHTSALQLNWKTSY
jgi:hypothetical protein